MPEPRARRTGTTLSREAIVARALELVAREGTGVLTVRRLGTELGVDPTAFYRHFRDKDDLVLACMDRAVETTFDALRDRVQPGASWQDWLRALADENWRIAGAYPAVYAVAFARTTGGPGEQRLVELLLEVIGDLGLGAAPTVLWYRSFADTILCLGGGRASDELQGEDVRGKEDRMWAGVYGSADRAEFPAIAAHAPWLSGVPERQIYDVVVEALIGAMASAAAEADGIPPGPQ